MDLDRASCSVDGCDDISLARGWCTMHYSRWRRTGDPLVRSLTLHEDTRYQRMPEFDPNDGFWDQVDKLRHERIMVT